MTNQGETSTALPEADLKGANQALLLQLVKRQQLYCLTIFLLAAEKKLLQLQL